VGNYLIVKCGKCKAEIKAEFREDLLKPQMIDLDGCFNCSIEKWKEESYANGFNDGLRQDGRTKVENEKTRRIQTAKHSSSD
jgi:hypothetical protein